MKKMLFPLVAILVLTAGCIYVTAPGTQGTNQGTTQTVGQLGLVTKYWSLPRSSDPPRS
ncbi:hypothetical protein HKBW3S33_02357, partial [Candidatus Hakubella thermalkaliphila]